MNKRKNVRLKNYDYRQKGFYFITICTLHIKSIFGDIVDDKMVLNDNGYLIKNIIERFNEKDENIKNDFYQIMPNHIHMIVEFKENLDRDLSSIISNFKSKCTRELGIKNLWQRNFYERVIRDEKEYMNVLEYINNNPYRDKYKW